MRRDLPAASADADHLGSPQFVLTNELIARSRADQDERTVAVAGLLQLRRDVHRGTDDGIVHARGRSDGAGKDGAGINADADADGSTAGRPLVMVPGGDLPHHAGCAFYRPVSIVSARCRNSECCHQSIAKELVNRSPIPVDAGDHEGQKLLEKAEGVGRSEFFDQLRKVANIDKEDCCRNTPGAICGPPGGTQIENQLRVDKARQGGAGSTQVHRPCGLVVGTGARFEQQPGIGGVVRHRAIPKAAISGKQKVRLALRRRSPCKVHAFRISVLPDGPQPIGMRIGKERRSAISADPVQLDFVFLRPAL